MNATAGRWIKLGLALALLAGAMASAAEKPVSKPTGTLQSTHLYTPPDPGAPGGIHGEIVSALGPLLRIFAMPQGNWRQVYNGTVLWDGREFRFSGLPADKYDLLVVYPADFFEGLTLARGSNTLTRSDRRKIDEIVMASSPFFETKKVHRLEGGTGWAAKARGVLQEVRTRPITLQSAEVRTDLQVRSIKLALLEDVGQVGWALVETRELIRQEVLAHQTRGLLPHHYSVRLSNIRVIDNVKEVGKIEL